MKISNALLLSIVAHVSVFAGVSQVLSILQLDERTQTITPIPRTVDMLILAAPEPQKMEEKKPVQNPSRKLKRLSRHTSSLSNETSSAHYLIADPDNSYPVYPASAQAAHLEGSFLVQLTLNARGHVTTVVFLEGEEGAEILKQVIKNALKKWKFKGSSQTLENIKIQVPINFILQEK